MTARWVVFVSVTVSAACGGLTTRTSNESGDAGVFDATQTDVPEPDAHECVLPPPDTPGAMIPCEVELVLGPQTGPIDDRRCRRCHVDGPENPVPLLTWRDTQVLRYGMSTRPMWQLMSWAVEGDWMPPVKGCWGDHCPLDGYNPPVKPLTQQEKSVLLAWLVCPEPIFDATCPVE